MKLFFYIAILLLANNCSSNGQIITTVAGNGFYSFSGDGGQATAAQLFYPDGLTADGAGNIYISDKWNNCIRKVSSTGIITTIAGNNLSGYSADGIAATTSKLNFPTGLTVDGSGNIIIADRDNFRVRKVSPAGIIATIAGIGIPSYFGDNGPATGAILNEPSAVAIDAAGNIFIADQYNHVIRKINTSGVIARFAGSASNGFSGDMGQATASQLSYPSGVAVDPGGNVYIADYTNSRIRKVNTSGIISTIAGKNTEGYSGDGGAATAAELNHPYAVMADATGNVFFSDCGNNCVRKISPSGIITTIAGNGNPAFSGDGGPATAARLCSPKSILKDAGGNIYIADSGSSRIRRINPSGIITTFAGGFGDGGPATANSLNPLGLMADVAGNIFVSDADNMRTCRISTSGTITTVAGSLVCGYAGDGGPAKNASLSYPSSVVKDAAGNLYITDKDNSAIRKVSASGIITTICGNGTSTYTGDGGPAINATMNQPNQAAFDVAGNLYIVDQVNFCVRKISTTGIISTVAGSGVFGDSGDGGPATAAKLSRPLAVAFDPAGNMIIADSWTGTLHMVNSAGIINTIAGTGTSGYSGDGGPALAAKMSPTGICIDSCGNIYISDSYERCRRINALGIITTIAGTGARGFGGDGGPATAAKLSYPNGIALDAAGNIYFSDYDNYRVRKIQSMQLPRITVPFPLCMGATATLSDAATGGTWTSTNTAVAVVGSSSGIVTGMSTGTATIIYDLFDNTTITTVTINPQPIAATISGPSTVCPGATITLTDLTPGGTWGKSNTTASVSGGIVTGVSPGTNTISYSVTNICGTVAATKAVTINPFPSAGTIAGPSSVCAGASITLSDAVVGGIWSTSSTSVSLSGSVVTGITAGVATISYTATATCGTATTTKTITVNPLPSAGAIAGAANLCIGASITLSDAITSGLWSSSSTSVSLSGGTITGITAGTATISYAVTTVCGTATTTRTITINPLPAADSIMGLQVVCVGASITLTDTVTGGVWGRSNATAFVSGGVVSGLSAGIDTISYSVTNSCGTAVATITVTVNPLASVGLISGPSVVCEGASISLTDIPSGGVWSSSNAAATVSTGGTVSGVSGGTATISYVITTSCGIATATAAVTINPLPIVGIINGPSNMCAGSYIVLTNSIPGGVWSSSNGNATVAGGVVGGISAGTDTISYSVTNGCGTIAAAKLITITPPLAAIVGPAGVCEGDAITLSNATAGGNWSTTNTLVATIGSGTGIVNGVAAGTIVITYAVGAGCETATSVTVYPLPAAISGASRVCVNATAVLSDLTPGGSWVSANHSLADIGSATGAVTGVAQGLVSITYTSPNGCFATTLFRIDPLPYAGVITGPDMACLDSVVMLSDTTSGGVWASSNLFASVSATGTVKGKAAGIDTIRYLVTNVCGTDTVSRHLTIEVCQSPGASPVLKVFPNPNDGNFALLLSSATNEQATLKINNLLGQRILELPMVANAIVPVSFSADQASGVYFISVIAGDKKYEAKVVIIH
jgi:sugar lactone lactonase YvrE